MQRMEIILCDYGSQAYQWIVNTASKTVERRDCANASDARHGSTGFGSYIDVGVFKRRPVFFGIFTNDGNLNFYADTTIFLLDETAQVVKRAVVYPFLSRAILQRQGQVQNWTYWHNELLEDGMHTRDFLGYIAETSGSVGKIEAFREYWHRSKTQ
jgi:hypothetical protein